MKNVYEFFDILSFLHDRLGGKSQRKGLKSLLAKHMGCQTSYLSQVLSGKAQLTLEQGAEAADFFQLSTLEKDYFLLLLQKERAGNHKLKSYYESKINDVITKKNNLAARLEGEAEDLSEEVKEKYYSNWSYLAIHVLVSIPEFNNVNRISEHLGLSKDQVEQALQFLLQYDFIKTENNNYAVGTRSVHLNKHHPLNIKHQLNWRIKALDKLDSKDETEVSFSGIYSLSKKDAEILKENIFKLIKSNLKVVGPSKEEVVYCTVIDFFKV